MGEQFLPQHYQSIRDRYPSIATALDNLGDMLRTNGPLDAKTVHLIQLAASVAISSEGGAHSHTRRALEAGATAEELYHAVLALTTTIGFPRAAAGVNWVDQVLEARK